MRYNKIRKMDISNGDGIRVSIFVQGCHFHCPGCFNPETHDFSGGIQFDENTLSILLKLLDKPWIDGLSILGGEPLNPENVNTVYEIVKAVKSKYPNKTIWLWTGYTYDSIININNELLQQINVLSFCDVLIDGQYNKVLYDPSLKFRGSSNQNIYHKINNNWYLINKN